MERSRDKHSWEEAFGKKEGRFSWNYLNLLASVNMDVLLMHKAVRSLPSDRTEDYD